MDACLALKFDVNYANRDGVTALHFATYNDDRVSHGGLGCLDVTTYEHLGDFTREEVCRHVHSDAMRTNTRDFISLSSS